MAQPKRNDEERQAVSKTDALESLNLGHAGLRSECWPSASDTRASHRNCGSWPARSAALRLQRPPRQRTPRHRMRPSRRAEARFISDDYEFLTD
jgi:hypothetical protein